MSTLKACLLGPCFAASLCFTLVGCGSQVDLSNYVGEWDLIYGSSNSMTAETVNLAKSLGDNATLTLNEDGTGLLDLYGDKLPLTWNARTTNEAYVQVEDCANASLKIENDELSLIDSQENSITFVRPTALL